MRARAGIAASWGTVQFWTHVVEQGPRFIVHFGTLVALIAAHYS